MQEVTLKVKERTLKGKEAAGQLKASGIIPGIYYGKGLNNIMLEIVDKELRAVMRKSNIQNLIFDLDVEGKSTEKAMIKDLQRHPYKDRIEHVDFGHIDMDKKITFDMHVTLIGESTGVKNSGGILQHGIRSVAIECLPGDMPDEIIIDISDMEVGESLHVRDLNLDEKITIITEPEIVLAVVSAPKVEGAESTDEEGDKTEEGAEDSSDAEKENKDA